MENLKVVITSILGWLKEFIIIKFNIPTISEIETIIIFITTGVITGAIGILALIRLFKDKIT